MCKVWAAQEYIYQSETYIKTKAIFLTCYAVPSGAIPIPWILWNCFFYSQHSSPLTLLKSMSWILLQSPKSHLTPFIYEQCQLSSLTEVLGVSVYGLSFIPILFLKALKGTPQNTVGEENCLSCVKTEKKTSWSQPQRMASCLAATLHSSSSTSEQDWLQRAYKSNHMEGNIWELRGMLTRLFRT